MSHTTVYDCNYCQTWTNAHDKEVLRKARKLCTNPLFEHFANAELDWADHAKLNEIGQIRFLQNVHDRSGCSCHVDLEATVSERLYEDQQSDPHTDKGKHSEPPSDALSYLRSRARADH